MDPGTKQPLMGAPVARPRHQEGDVLAIFSIGGINYTAGANEKIQSQKTGRILPLFVL